MISLHSLLILWPPFDAQRVGPAGAPYHMDAGQAFLGAAAGGQACVAGSPAAQTHCAGLEQGQVSP